MGNGFIYMKYGNKKTEYNGEKFDSRLEARRYTELALMERAGVIKDLRRQVPFELIPPYVTHGRKVRPAEYIADFVYEKDGETVVEDTKGVKTEVYKLKKKLFEYRYPTLELREIKREDIRK